MKKGMKTYVPITTKKIVDLLTFMDTMNLEKYMLELKKKEIAHQKFTF